MLSDQVFSSGFAQMVGPPNSIVAAFIFAMISLVPIIIALTRHQQKMAQIMRQDQPQPLSNDSNLAAISYEVQQLKSMVATLALSVDSLKEEVRGSNSIQDRVKISD